MNNQLKIVVSLLAEFSQGNIPKHEDYEEFGVTNENFNNIIYAMQKDNLIENVEFAKGGNDRILLTMCDDVRITIRGMEYLQQNSPLMKTYKGLKELRDWLPF